jgi:hypothetical protein
MYTLTSIDQVIRDFIKSGGVGHEQAKVSEVLASLTDICAERSLDVPGSSDYEVEVEYKARGTYIVRALSSDIAKEMTEEGKGPCGALPKNAELVDDTFKVIKVTRIGN